MKLVIDIDDELYKAICECDDAQIHSHYAIKHGIPYEDRPHEDLGKWDISEVRCPECLEYFDLDVYPKEKLYKCPNCRADMHIGKGAAE